MSLPLQRCPGDRSSAFTALSGLTAQRMHRHGRQSASCTMCVAQPSVSRSLHFKDRPGRATLQWEEPAGWPLGVGDLAERRNGPADHLLKLGPHT